MDCRVGRITYGIAVGLLSLSACREADVESLCAKELSSLRAQVKDLQAQYRQYSQAEPGERKPASAAPDFETRQLHEWAEEELRKVQHWTDQLNESARHGGVLRGRGEFRRDATDLANELAVLAGAVDAFPTRRSLDRIQTSVTKIQARLCPAKPVQSAGEALRDPAPAK